MGLFNDLKAMMPPKGTVLLSLASVDGDESQLRLTITPIAHEDDREDHDPGSTQEILNRPIVVTATPDELDVELCEQLQRFIGKRRSMTEEFEALDKELETAKADSKKAIEEEKARAKKGVPTLPTPPPITPPAPKPEPKAPAALF